MKRDMAHVAGEPLAPTYKSKWDGGLRRCRELKSGLVFGLWLDLL